MKLFVHTQHFKEMNVGFALDEGIGQDVDCNCIVTRGGVYNEILPEPEGNPKGRARGIS